MENYNDLLTTINNYYYFNNNITILQIKSGLINATYRLITPQKNFILQEINPIFKHPHRIDHNINALDTYLSKKNIDFQYPKLFHNLKDNTITPVKQKYLRVFYEIENGVSYDLCLNKNMGFEAGSLLGKMYRALNKFDTNQLKPTLKNFHNLIVIEKEFLKSFKNAPHKLILKANKAVQLLNKYSWITSYYQKLTEQNILKIRPTHHDTKISNFLFDKNQKAIAIIDFDTFFPGYFLSDLGDMYRTYLPEFDENKKINNFKIEIKQDIYISINNGFNAQIQNVLSKTEQKFCPFAGYFMIYMQALRFLTDYFKENIYYPINYPTHNLIRAQNQLGLLSAYDSMVQYKYQ
ncbi:MAG: aminoglycoside phosphotransferase family protein [Alphaproteobacteria bacterium]|nr:aminoglycoside phosphotransferase family protein [Alphaproteobacteria bacterium]